MRSSFTLSFFYKSIITSALLFYFTNNINAQISGTVFRDFNGDGVKAVTSSSSLEPGVKGITVTAYPTTGTLQTTTTDNSGNYSFSGLTLPVRIEFSNLPNGTFASSFGSGSGTSVQFYSAATSNANLGINNPAHYSQANPDLITPKHLTGDPLASSSNMSSDAALYKFPNTASGDAQSGGTALSNLATQAQIGSTWGVAYERVSKKFFMSSVYRRHAPLGPGETGGRIYVIDNANSNTPGTPTKFIDLVSDLAISVGTIETNVARGLPDNKFTASEDNNTFSAAGKVGLGDIDISDDGQFLFVVNLFDKKVYKVDIAQVIAGTPNAVALPDFTLPCSNGSSRPWGLGMWDGELYLGVVCDAASGANADLRMTVQKFNFTTNSWTEVFNVTPDWDKGDVIFGSTKFKWQKWEDVWNNFVAPNWPVHPQPIIGDIEFDEEGSMHLAVLDRTGFQSGHRQKRVPDNGSLYTGVTAGELLRTYKDPSTGTFILESNGSCGPYVTGGTGNSSQTGQGGPNTLQGPGGGEFYCDDHTTTAHSETTNGGLALVKGSLRLASVQMDPIDGQVDASGLVWFNTTNGLETQEYQIFQNGSTPSPDFSKQNGLGDLEYLSDPAPIEIGNRVFMDTDSDGEQDADEMGLDGIKVELWKAGSKVTETTTANGGQWYFTNVDFNTDYEVKILAASFPSGKSLTTTNVASNAKDLIDSDATLIGSDAVIAYKTGSSGQNNHSLDFGFKVGCTLTTSATATNTNCNGGNDGSATATPTGNLGAVTYLWSNSATTDVATGLSAGVYTVTVTETPSCTATASVTVTEPADLTLVCTKTDATTTGGNDGTATVTASGGTAPYVYLWSNGATTNAITGLTAGTYTVTVTDAKGCSDVCNSQVNEPGCNLTASTTGTNVKCYGGNDGSATAIPTGNLSAVTYLWSNGATTATISNLIAGTYNVTVTESANCIATANYIVTEPSDLTVVCTKTDVTTTGGNDGTAQVTASGGTTIYAYLWSNGATTASVTGLTAGTYNVTVTDANGCSDACSVTLIEPIITACTKPNAGADEVLVCTNQVTPTTVTLVAAPVGTTWSILLQPANVTASISQTGDVTNMTATGKYLFLLTNNSDNTCKDTVEVRIKNCPELPLCGTDKYELNADAGLTMYQWFKKDIAGTTFDPIVGETNASITVSTVGSYTWTAKDGNGCDVSACDTVKFSCPCALTVTTTATNVTCNGKNDGTAQATVTGNVGAVTYLWSNGQTTATANGLNPGTHSVTVTETPTCKTVASISITEPAALVLSCDKIDVTMSGGNNGQASVTAVGGTTPYAYVWSNGATTASITGLAAGTYTVTVIDAKGCFDICSSTLSEPSALGSLGDLIWKDLNNNGLQDNGEAGVAGVIVELYNADANGKPTSAVLATDTTDTNGNYLFTNLSNGVYVVKIITSSIMNTMEISIKQNVGPDDEVDNDFDKTSGLSTKVTIDVNDPLKKDIVSVDGAIVNKPVELGSLGDFIWKDLNDNGLQENTETGVAGVVLTLFFADPWGKPIGNALKADTTDANGKYLFTNLESGRYVVVLDPTSIMSTMELSKKQDSGVDDAIDNDFNSITFYAGSVIVDPTDPAKKDVLTVDGAIINKPLGSIGDFVWKDLNDNGLQDNGEAGVSGVIITLFNSDASGAIVGAALANDTTDTNGAYLFPNLPKGDYVLQMVPASIMPSMELSPKVGIGNDTLNNDFSPITWLTPKVSIDPTDPAKKDITTVDGAIINKPLGSIGDFVWKDLNDNGLQDNSEVGVSGIIITLFKSDASGAIVGAALANDTTDINGAYLFPNLPKGDYVLQMVPASIMPTMELSPKVGIGNDTLNNDFSPITWLTPKISIDPYDPAKKDIITVDGAIINKVVVLGSIGDYVWMDMDNNGTQDNGEAAVSGVILELYLASNLTTPIKKDTTDSNGKYLFTELAAGDYVVKAVSSSFPAGKIVGKKDATTDDKDSDFDATTFQSPTITLNPGNTGGDPLKKDNLTIDLGLYLPINCPAKICTPVKVTKVK